MSIKRSNLTPDEFSEIAYDCIKSTMIGYEDFISFDTHIMDKIEENQEYIDFLDSIEHNSEEEFITNLSKKMRETENSREFIEFLFYCLSQTNNDTTYDFREKSWNMSEISSDIEDKTVAKELSSALSSIGLYRIVSETNSIKDYYMGVNVGFASDKRKGKQGTSYEDIIQKDLARFVDKINSTYNFNLTLSEQYKYNFNNSEGQKTFDFFISDQDSEIKIAIEVNCYSTTGSKISEISRSSENQRSKCERDNIEYVRITDGSGLSKKNLKDAHIAVDGNLYNLELFRENFKEVYI